jgi:hypothetical protein
MPKQPILITTAIPPRTVQKLIAFIIQSEDKLFFVNHSVTATEGRKEWKLIQVNFEKSIQQQPACLQNERFLVDFYIEHHRDKPLDIRDRRFWLEYHKIKLPQNDLDPISYIATVPIFIENSNGQGLDALP